MRMHSMAPLCWTRALPLALLVVGPSLVAGVRATAEDSVTLRFAWPERIELGVERVYTRNDRSPDGKKEARSVARYGWRGQRRGAEYVVDTALPRYTVPEPAPETRDPLVILDFLNRQLEPAAARVVIGENGTIDRVEDIAGLRAEMRRFFGQAPGLLELPALQQPIAHITSDGVLRDQSSHLWNRTVGAWAGAEVVRGQPLRIEGELGLGAGTPTKATFTYELLERVGCRAGAASQECVRLQLTQEPVTRDTREKIAAILGPELARSIPAGEALIVNRFTVDTDPKTLVPVRYVEDKRWDISWQDESGQEMNLGRRERIEFSFERLRRGP